MTTDECEMDRNRSTTPHTEEFAGGGQNERDSPLQTQLEESRQLARDTQQQGRKRSPLSCCRFPLATERSTKQNAHDS